MPLLLGINLGIGEMLFLAVILVILFGQRLPEVARQVGGIYREFRKHVSSVQAEFMAAADEVTRDTDLKKPFRPKPKKRPVEERDEPTAPRFEPPPAAPRETAPAEATGQETGE